MLKQVNMLSECAATADESEENLRKTGIIVPMTGTVSLLSVELGERVVGTSQMAGTELLQATVTNGKVDK